MSSSLNFPIALAALLMAATGIALLFLPDPASTEARRIDALHFAVIGTTMLGATIVFVVTLAFVLRFRRRGPPAATPTIRPPRSFEIVHSVLLLGLFFVFWGVGFMQYVRMQELPISPPRLLEALDRAS